MKFFSVFALIFLTIGNYAHATWHHCSSDSGEFPQALLKKYSAEGEDILRVFLFVDDFKWRGQTLPQANYAFVSHVKDAYWMYTGSFFGDGTYMDLALLNEDAVSSEWHVRIMEKVQNSPPGALFEITLKCKKK